jgi:hypothetical protein
MQRETNRFVIGRENNVVRVDFSRDPDPPAPKFPGASGLRRNPRPGRESSEMYRCNSVKSGTNIFS